TVSLAALWTRNASVSTGVQQAKYLSIDRTGANYNSLDRAYGMSVRCIKSKPDTDTTGEYQAVVSGTLLRNVWLDRNLGATQKATSGTDSNAYGTYYKLGKATCPTNFTLPSEKDLKVLIAELGEGRYIVQNAFFSAMALPAAGHEKDDRTVGSSIYLRGAGNQVVLINSERGNGRFYEDKAENNDGIPVRCIKETSSIGSDASTELVTLTITDNSPKPNGSGKGIIGAAKTVTFTFDFSEPVVGFTVSDVKIENGKIVAGAIIPVSEAPANTRWTLTAFPTQGMSSNSLVVTIPANSALDRNANGNVIASRSVSLNTEPPKAIVIEKWATNASADKGSGAKQLIGKPDLGLNLGDPAVKNHPKSWLEGKGNKGLTNLTLTYDKDEPLYIQSVVIRQTFNTGGGVDMISGIDSDGKETPLYNAFNDELSEVSGADRTNSSWGMQVNDRTIALNSKAMRLGPFYKIKVLVGVQSAGGFDGVDAVKITGFKDKPL
ncbi:hypothetical protein BSPWISOX_1799, partial [uncultured Gammaproteobacteria bacterium]